MTELEARVERPAIALPMDYLSALKALVAQTERTIALESQNAAKDAKIEADAPKVEFCEEVTADNLSTFTIHEAAKILDTKESSLRNLLHSYSMIFKNLQGQWEPYAEYVRRGWLTLKIETVNRRVIKFPAITTRGLAAIRDRLAQGDMFKHATVPGSLVPQ